MIGRLILVPVLVAASVAHAPSAAVPPVPKPKDAAALARSYVDAWQPALGAIVAEERYGQTLTTWDTHRSTRVDRTLVSDVLLVQAPRSDVWMLFRDVMTVDGEPVRDREQRFEALFVTPGRDVIPTASRIAGESARYNLGSVARTLNTPAAALIFLRGPFVGSTKWQRVAVEEVDGRSAWKLTFEQTKAPFAIRTATGRGQPASGHFWLEAGTGRLLRTAIECWIMASPRDPRVHVRVSAAFGPVPSLDVWVPLRMSERYEVWRRGERRMIERLEAEATYTNHRRFQTGARLVE